MSRFPPDIKMPLISDIDSWPSMWGSTLQSRWGEPTFFLAAVLRSSVCVCVYSTWCIFYCLHLASASMPSLLAVPCQEYFSLFIRKEKEMQSYKKENRCTFPLPPSFCLLVAQQVSCHLPLYLHGLLIGDFKIVYCALLFLCSRAKTKATRPCEVHICMR